MGTTTIKHCDSCKTDDRKVDILSYDFRRSDGLRVVGDLCGKCFDRMAREYGLSVTSRRRRTDFAVVEELPPA